MDKMREIEKDETGFTSANQRLWHGAIVLAILRGAIKDPCYERGTNKMTDHNKFSPSVGRLRPSISLFPENLSVERS